ncbi:hypothetical protein [Phenylobacterium sp.]|uniref:hypothetical protein n=1 Tax=Phenylobacterium sp. TaxID=1871053 RepID=UPI00286D2AAE|nr:hypothetical protein [Phenylobacterium sp.]
MVNSARILAAAVALIGASPSSAAVVAGVVPVGVWGGDQAILTVGEDGASLKTGCAEGHIPGPVRVDRKGRISAHGTFQSFTPGPQRADEEPGALDAAFTGRMSGQTLRLTVRASADPAAHSFTLRRDAHPKLIRCL